MMLIRGDSTEGVRILVDGLEIGHEPYSDVGRGGGPDHPSDTQVEAWSDLTMFLISFNIPRATKKIIAIISDAGEAVRHPEK